MRNGHYFAYEDYKNVGCVDLNWYSTEALAGDAKDERLTLAFMLCGAYAKGGLVKDDDVFVALNMHWEDQPFKLPKLAKKKAWHVFANTGAEAPEEIHELGSEPRLSDQKKLDSEIALSRGLGRALVTCRVLDDTGGRFRWRGLRLVPVLRPVSGRRH